MSAQDIRILLLDDHALFRESVARLLGSEPGFHVVAQCGSIDEALAELRRARIDIVLLDLDLGHHNGIEFIRLAKEQQFGGKTLVVTAGLEQEEAAECIRSGVAGIFMKHHSAASLAQEIRNVMAGQVSFEQRLFQGVVAKTVDRHADAETERLSPRERQVLSGIFEGLANKEIAGRIGISESSVKASLQQLFAKTGVRTRSQLVRIALERHWTSP